MTQKYSELTAKEINNMSYNELIGLVKETNRPPGGEKIIAKVVRETFLREGKKVLEIGTSTGVTAIELARMSGAHVTGIDINPHSLEEASSRSKKFKVENNTTFKQQDATNTTFEKESFDMVFCGNVTSLISNREKALSEYIRVLKIGGYLVAIPMYYIKTPSEELVQDVREAIKVPIKVHYKDYWMKMFKDDNLQVFSSTDYSFDNIDPGVVDKFVEEILSREHLHELNQDAKKSLDTKYQEQMQLFRTNLAHMGFTVLILRKEPEPMDAMLFTSTKIQNE